MTRHNGGHALVLLSGGVDSAVCAKMARESRARVDSLFFSYGQRHEAHERAAALAVHADLGLNEQRFARLASVPGPLTGASDLVRMGDADAVSPAYLPARNLLFIATAAGYAEASGANEVWIGANLSDHRGFPDCRPAFIRAMRTVLGVAMSSPVDLVAPLIDKPKAAVWALGRRHGVPLGLTWSCYTPEATEHGPRQCGRCDACTANAAASDARTRGGAA